METNGDNGVTPKMESKDFIQTVNGCLDNYYRNSRSSFGSVAYPTMSSCRRITKEEIEDHTRSRSFACIFHDLAKANHWHQAVQFLNNCLQFYLPPVTVIQNILDTMLVIDAESFVVEAQLYIHHLFTFYPPNTDDMTLFYWEILKEEELEQKRVSSPRDPCGSFINVLHQLEVVLNSLNEKNCDSSCLAVSVSCMNFEEKSNEQREDGDEENDDISTPSEELLELCDATMLTGRHMKIWWENASCEEKIQRLLYVLYMMNEIFQLDIDVWKKRSVVAQKHPLVRPIISRLIWPYDDVNPTSMTVKMVVNMYIISHRNNLFECADELERLICFIALTLPSSPLDGGEGYPPDSHQRRVFAQHIATALIDSGIDEDRMETALARLTPDWFRLIVSSKVHSHYSSQSCGDMPLNVAQLAQMILQGLSWEEEANFKFDLGLTSDEDDSSASSKKHKTRPIKRNAKGETQLHVLARTGKSEKLSQLLVKEGRYINLADYAGWTPVHEAVSHGHLECVRVLCEYKPEEEKHQKDLSESSGKKDVAESSKKAETSSAVNLHIRGGDMGLTPLHEAVIQSQIHIADLLLQVGGSSLLNDTTNAGLTPLDLANGDEMMTILKRRKEEGRIREKEWISNMKSNTLQLPHSPSGSNCISLRCMLLHCYLDVHCLFDIKEKLKMVMVKPENSKSKSVRNIDYMEKSHDLKALRYLQRCLKSRLCGKVTLPEAYLIALLW